MLEAMIVFSIVYAIMLMPLRGKTFDQLTETQKQRVYKNYQKYRKANKPATVEGFLPMLQKQALIYLILALVLIPLYIVVVVFIYPMIFAV